MSTHSSSLIQSPTLPRQFTLDDSIIPESVTRPPTIRQNEAVSMHPDVFHSQLALQLSNLSEFGGEADYHVHPSSPGYYSQSSHPVSSSYGDSETSPTAVTPTLPYKPPFHRRARANRNRGKEKERLKRLSHSLDDIGALSSESKLDMQKELEELK